jgi:hypothetical protein
MIRRHWNWLWSILGGCLGCAAAFGADAVNESARKIPVAYEADVVVVGGGTGAV